MDAHRPKFVMKMVSIAEAVELVANTGDFEAVRVFELGPWTER